MAHSLGQPGTIFVRAAGQVLQPRRPLALAECVRSTVDEQEAFFLKNGFVILPAAVGPEQLRRIQAAWELASAPARAQWERDKVGGEGVRGQNFAVPPAGGPSTHRTFYDIPGFLEQDDAFLEVVDLPAVVALVGRLCGTAPDRGAPLPQSHGFPPSEQSPPGIC